MTSVPRILIYLRHAEETEVGWVISTWGNSKILEVVPWKGPDGTWALKIDLTDLKKPGEEGYVPFPWVGDNKPTVPQAVYQYRNMTVRHM